MRLVNARNDRVVANRLEMAASRATRKRGLLGRTGRPGGAALVLTPCCAVHTVGMRFAIDAVFVDAHGRVKKVVRDLKPWRIACALSARAVIEMASGALGPEGALMPGDRLYLELSPRETRPPISWEAVSAAAG
jgi:uncharacterized membrane protein (UPF0127 family)